jgi:hypothetical protein
MSEIKVNKISPRSGTDVTLGDSSDTFTVPSGATLTIACGATISNAGTASGFGAITWCTTAKTGAFCAAAGKGYLVNTTSTAFTATLPASPTVGDQIAFVDFAGTFDCNALTVGANTKKIKGSTCDALVEADRGAIQIIYTGTTQGWITTSQANAASMSQESFIAATGGNTTITDGNYKIHVFTGTGNLCISAVGNAAGSDTLDYLIVGGGGGGGDGTSNSGGGAGAGGYREGSPPSGGYTKSPIAAATGISASVGCLAVTVGAGGTGGPCSGGAGTAGGVSTYSTITSAGGGIGGYNNLAGGTGGSGGGGSNAGAGGAGNVPCVSPAQGNPGSNYPCGPSSNSGGGGGGGAKCAAPPNPTGAPPIGGVGGEGANIGGDFFGPTSPSYGTPGPSPTSRYFAGGGGGVGYASTGTVGTGGAGGGGPGGPPSPGVGQVGTTNTGGGGGGGRGGGYTDNGGNGGPGFVAIRYKFQ